MKKFAAAALCLGLGASLTACGGNQTTAPATQAEETTAAETTAAETTAEAASGETLTGSAEGFGGEVTVTLTMDGDKVTACSIKGDDETPDIGGKAFADLEKQIVDANGIEIDGVSGATVTSNAVKEAAAQALGLEIEETEAETKEAETAAPAAIVEIDGGLQIGQAYTAAHGTKCFTQAVAVVQDDVIIAAYIDEYQFIDSSEDVTGVPNSDSDFAEGYAEGLVLCSKRENAEYYSALMADHGGSTVAIDTNFNAIESFAVGKTIDELTKTAEGDGAVDAVSGATLVDTAGYLNAIAEAAKAAKNTQAVEFTGDSSALKLNVINGAAHGTKCFTTAAALTDGETIVLSYIDEFQFIDSSADVTGVPNSDAEFAEGYAEGKVLCSKRVNTAYYSKNMADKGGSTVTIDANFDAIQNHMNGMTIKDATDLAGSEAPVDAISGATLADTAGYMNTVLEAANK
ncbi:MAG: FMN-binding protein [Lachnospiraceae bacterium]|nr:FMN-binding protein [Lachnospiraceae bacterium]